MPNDLQNFSYQAVAQGLETLKGALAWFFAVDVKYTKKSRRGFPESIGG